MQDVTPCLRMGRDGVLEAISSFWEHCVRVISKPAGGWLRTRLGCCQGVRNRETRLSPYPGREAPAAPSGNTSSSLLPPLVAESSTVPSREFANRAWNSSPITVSFSNRPQPGLVTQPGRRTFGRGRRPAPSPRHSRVRGLISGRWDHPLRLTLPEPTTTGRRPCGGRRGLSVATHRGGSGGPRRPSGTPRRPARPLRPGPPAVPTGGVIGWWEFPAGWPGTAIRT